MSSEEIRSPAGPAVARIYAAPPVGDHQKHNRQARGECKARYVPRQPIETLRRRLGHDAFAIFLNEGLQGKVVGLVACHHLIEFFQHRGGCGAPHVVAGGEDLVAAAHADQVLAEFLGALGLLSADRPGGEPSGKREGEQRDEPAMSSHGFHSAEEAP